MPPTLRPAMPSSTATGLSPSAEIGFGRAPRYPSSVSPRSAEPPSPTRGQGEVLHERLRQSPTFENCGDANANLPLLSLWEKVSPQATDEGCSSLTRRIMGSWTERAP